MASALGATAGPPLDEIQWKASPQDMASLPGGLHSNTILFMFRWSPFYDHTSNNEVLYQQGLVNPNMFPFLTTRELFEGRLNTMSGLEYRVAQEPAETGPGMGTGVWVINKQTRQKRQGEEDEITIHTTYFVVGENVYMAPTLSDIISAKIASISSLAATLLPIADSVQTWSPARGRIYPAPATQKEKEKPSSKQAPDSTADKSATSKATTTSTTTIPDSIVLESLMIHDQYGAEFMDLNPITGTPGAFQLSSTGRKEKLPVQPPKSLAAAALPIINTKAAAGDNPLAAPAGKTGKETKSPRTPGMPKLKRRKSKMAVTPS